MNKSLIISLCFFPCLGYAQLSCHLHPPNSKLSNESSKGLLGPFKTRDICEQENQAIYQLKGRCHCQFSQSNMPFLLKPSL